jgi:hypothetical protein
MEDGSLILDAHYWRGISGRKCIKATIESLYDRYLVKIIVESRHRRRHTVKLTEVGELTAREIERQFSAPQPPGSHHKISERASRFIAEVTS